MKIVLGLIFWTSAFQLIFLYESGWVGFFCAVWLGTKKSMGLAKHSLCMTGSALSAYSSARHARRHQELGKVSD